MSRKGIPTAADLEIQAGALMMRAEARRIIEAGRVGRIRDARLAKNISSIITRQIQSRIAQDEEIRRSRAERSAQLILIALLRKVGAIVDYIASSGCRPAATVCFICDAFHKNIGGKRQVLI